MLLPNFVRSPRLFLYLGFGLIFLALTCFPARVRVVVQPEVMETELWHVGPIYALWTGAWSLPGLLLGIIESSISKKAVLPILCLANIVLAGLIWDAVRFWRGMLIQWLITYSPILAPCMIANAIALLYLMKNEKIFKTLENPIIRILLIITFTAVPILIAGGALCMWLRTIFY